MKSVKIYWAKIVILSLCLVALTVVSTMYFTSRGTAPDMDNGSQTTENEIGEEFMQIEPVFPEGFQSESPSPRKTNKKKDQKIMIRRLKNHDLDPQPPEWPECQPAIELNSNEIPAHRPPKCILLGFAKCGTSALLEFLELHPKIVSLKWEPDYFCDRMYMKYDITWYVNKMPYSFSDQITIEKSPCYIVEHDSHLRMQAMNSSIKVMVIIRDPITRLLSEYGHYYATQSYWGRLPVTFEGRVYNAKTQQFREQVLKVGNYNPHFEHLLKVFPRDQLLIVDGDKFVTDPLSQTRRIEKFLGIEHAITKHDVYFDTEKGFYCMKLKDSQETKCMGTTKGRKHADIDPDFKRKLINFLRPYSERFFKLVGQRFDWVQ